jgi:hypothetical protein
MGRMLVENEERLQKVIAADFKTAREEYVFVRSADRRANQQQSSRLYCGGKCRRAAHRGAFPRLPDKEINEVGARGIGEIGLTGIAAAITAAVHRATGVRVRELPVRIENLLA